ncbi:MAG: hypothetical protein P8144_09205 [Gammaproteobacteria bacterium]
MIKRVQHCSVSVLSIVVGVLCCVLAVPVGADAFSSAPAPQGVQAAGRTPRLLWVESSDTLRCAMTDALPFDANRCERALPDQRRATHLRDGLRRWLLSIPDEAVVGLGRFSAQGTALVEPVESLGLDRGWSNSTTATLTDANQQYLVRGQQRVATAQLRDLVLDAGDASAEIRLIFEQLRLPPAAYIESAALVVRTRQALSAPLTLSVALQSIDPYANDVFQAFDRSAVSRVRRDLVLPIANQAGALQKIDITLLMRRWISQRTQAWCFGEGVGVSLSAARGVAQTESVAIAGFGVSAYDAPRLVVRFRSPPERHACAIRHTGASVRAESDDGVIVGVGRGSRTVQDDAALLRLRRQQPVFIVFSDFRFPPGSQIRVLNARLRLRVAETLPPAARVQLTAWRVPAESGSGKVVQSLETVLLQNAKTGNRLDWRLDGKGGGAGNSAGSGAGRVGSTLVSPNLDQVLTPVLGDRAWRSGDTLVIGLVPQRDGGALAAFQLGADDAPSVDVSWRGVYPMADMRTHRQRLLEAIDTLPAEGAVGTANQVLDAYQYVSGRDPCQPWRVTTLFSGETARGAIIDRNHIPDWVQQNAAVLDALGGAAGSAFSDEVDTLRSGTALMHFLAQTQARSPTGSQRVSTLLTVPTSIDALKPAASTSSSKKSAGAGFSPVLLSFFEPSARVFWRGNVRRFRWDWAAGRLVDAHGNPVLESSVPGVQRVKPNVVDQWSVSSLGGKSPGGKPQGGKPQGGGPSGDAIARDGVASALPTSYASAPARRLYTYTGAYREKGYAQTPVSGVLRNGEWHGVDVSQPEHAIQFQKPLIQAMGIAQYDVATQRRVINWLRGGAKGETVATRLGAFLSAEPVWVNFPTPAHATVFVGSNQGLLHAIDAQTGQERWAFMPPRFLPKVPRWYQGGRVAQDDGAHDSLLYGWSGPLTVWRSEVSAPPPLNGGASPTPTVRVMLYGGWGRGGRGLIALDVSDSAPDNLAPKPRLQFEIRESDAGPYARLGQIWAKPTLARLRVSKGGRSVIRPVLVFGGGYDPRFFDGETRHFNRPSVSTRGNAIYAVDAVDGTLLWWASSQALGQVFRVTFSDASAAPSSTTTPAPTPTPPVRIKRIADLGGVGREARRFFEAPSVAVTRSSSGTAQLALAFGSGNRALPTDRFLTDGLFVVFDDLFERSAQTRRFRRAVDLPLVQDGQVKGASMPAVEAGWRLMFGNKGRKGEKVWGAPLIHRGVLYATTWTPFSGTPARTTVCSLPNDLGQTRLYRMQIAQGEAVLSGGSGAPAAQWQSGERSRPIAHAGRFPSMQVLIDQNPSNKPSNKKSNKTHSEQWVMMVGTEVIPLVPSLDSERVIKTAWRRIR